MGGIDDQWQADLVDVTRLKKENRGMRFLLTCIDVFSKYAWVVPLKDKTGKSLVAAFKRITKERQPRLLQTDKGTEFTNRTFQNYLKHQGITFFTTHNEETKASVVERFNRTLKTRMWRYFSAKQTKHYLRVLPALVRAYNQTHHRSIGMAPGLVDRHNAEAVWHHLYGHEPFTSQDVKFQVGDNVRLSKVKRHFDKGYLPNWTREVFVVTRVLNTRPTTYRVADESGEPLEGSFYAQELQKVSTPEVYLIDTILDQKGRGRNRQYLVHWKGYPKSFDSWVKAKDLQAYKG